MTDGSRLRKLAVAVLVIAAVGAGFWWTSTGEKRHATAVIEDALVDMGIDPSDASFFNYFRNRDMAACSDLPEGDRWFGNRAAKIFFPEIDPYPAAIEHAERYEADGWTVRRAVKPAGQAIPESRSVESTLGEDRLLVFFTEGSISASVNSGPCVAVLDSEDLPAGFEAVAAFD